ncbi:sugar-binding transcriptional regulator [Occultella glacieicola]|uniref:Sugar-binding transcriptional regulator n=1 Tax=Occultella glacieicola TaxID=2518684 RepID=A0ABY2E6Y5_9MICO|nr:sugar-binding domain-containing protein [Occultella glacieicola]TDE94071.1 sugar-binding transcriptional regulator [Occultella glacieicola]
MPVGLNPDEHELLARIAHRSYVDARTQEQIAEEFALSRPKVGRLLERARATGVVDIHIDTPRGLDLGLEDRLAEVFGLRHAIVAPAAAEPAEQRALVGRSAARYLERRLADGQRVAVGHGRDLAALAAAFREPTATGCVFVSAMGGSPSVDAPTNPNEIARVLADAADGTAHSLYAPAYVADGQVRDQLRRQDAVGGVFDLAATAALALVGIGGTDDECTMVRSGCLSAAEIARLRARGAVGDVLGTYLDAAGAAITAPHSERVMGLSLTELRNIPAVVAVACGPEKPLAILGVLRAGIVDALVVDEPNARAVLNLQSGARADRAQES